MNTVTQHSSRWHGQRQPNRQEVTDLVAAILAGAGVQHDVRRAS